TAVRDLLCLYLEKNPRNRRSSATDVRLDIEAALRTPSPAIVRQNHRWWMATAGLLMVSIVAASIVAIRAPKNGPLVAFDSRPGEGATLVGGNIGASSTAINSGAVSPDGQMIAFTSRAPSGKILLYIRRFDSQNAQPLAKTEDAYWPFWAP